MKNLREINGRLAEMENILSTREFTDEEKAKYEALKREFSAAQRENDIEQREAQARSNAAKVEFSLTKAIRSALHNKVNQINLREAITTAGLQGKAIELELQSILEPLHANSALTKLGVKWYTGMPMGDITIPVMGKGSVSWAGETGKNETDGTPSFGNNITLKPHRLTGYFDITEQMLLQDTIGVEAALRREAVAALADAYEATVLGNEAGTDNKPAGLFYGKTLKDATTFAKVCELESEVEDNCIAGELKYLLGTKAKADFRGMAKSTKNTQLVMEGGTIDGTPAVVTQNVKKTTGEGVSAKAEGIFAYGNFANLACASWSDLIIKVDDSIVYANGKIRIYVSGYFDAKVLRDGAFVFGNTRYNA